MPFFGENNPNNPSSVGSPCWLNTHCLRSPLKSFSIGEQASAPRPEDDDLLDAGKARTVFQRGPFDCFCLGTYGVRSYKHEKMRFNPRAEVAAVWLSKSPLWLQDAEASTPDEARVTAKFEDFYPEMIVDSYILVLLPGLMDIHPRIRKSISRNQ